MPSHLRSSEAFAPLSLPLDYGGPGVADFEREGICTTYLKMSVKEAKVNL